MKLHRSLLLGALLAGCAEAPSTAPSALLTDTCIMGGDADTPWFKAASNVDVWITVRPDSNPMTATGLSDDLFQNAVRQALNIWNEESGASIRLRLRGFTDHGRIDGALTITGRTDVCDGARAIALPLLDNDDELISTVVELRQGARGAPSDPCLPQPWVATPTGGVDVVAILVHEIGHAVFNLAEVGQPDKTCADFGQVSVMRAPGRVLSNWDQEMAQTRTGARGPLGRFHWTEMSGPASWFSVSEAEGMKDIQPLFRPGSMSTGKLEPWFGWVQSVDDRVQTGGGGRGDVHRWRNGSEQWTLHTAPDGALGRPVAVASARSGELLLAYQTVPEGKDVYLTRQGQICWRSSVDEGASWSQPTCPGRALAGGYGLTATYDPRSDAFLVGYVANADGTNTFNVSLLTVPAAGSSTPQQVSTLLYSSTHAPGLACRGDTGDCMLAVKQRNAWGTLGTTWFTIDPATGVAYNNLAPLQNVPLRLYDTPSLVYVPEDDSYRLAYAVDSAAIYSYRKNASGGGWIGTGDIFNSGGANVSSPVLAVLPDPDGRSFAHAWFVRYW